MALALYAPGVGYYAGNRRKFGATPASGSDFVTAPELSPLFGATVAEQVAEALQHTQTDCVWEFGAGSGALAAALLLALGPRVRRYCIVELSASLRQRQQQALSAWAGQVHWVDALPERFEGVVVGNEVLDAMPVTLLHRQNGEWLERGVACAPAVPQPPGPAIPAPLHWADRPTEMRPPVPVVPEDGDYLTEIHPQAEAFVRTLADRLQRGAVFLIDYGFPEHEYYHPQRHMGTLMCHHGHRADPDPLQLPGDKDITAHVNFTGIALAAQDAGMQVLGYTSQARFLLNCGLLSKMEHETVARRADAHKLIAEHEMGELFKVLALGVGTPWEPMGFAQGDRSHRL